MERTLDEKDDGEKNHIKISLAVYLSWRCAFNIKIQWWVSFRVGNIVVVIIIENIRRKEDESGKKWVKSSSLPLSLLFIFRSEGKGKISVDSGVSIEATSGVWNFTFLLAHRIYLPTHSLPSVAPFYIHWLSTLNRSIKEELYYILVTSSEWSESDVDENT